MTLLQKFKSNVKKYLKRFKNRLNNRVSQENDAIYRILYQCVHDNEQALPLASSQTVNAFSEQWRNLPKGDALLSESWFRDNVSRILYEEELQINPSWFFGKEVLDAGCGNGRWSYGLAQLGANITAVDVNQVALDETCKALKEFSVKKNFIQSPLEKLCSNVQNKQFDLVLSWGVVHHCESFNQALNQLIHCVKDGGILYLYLYGRESLPFNEDLSLFKERIIYNSLFTSDEKFNFLLKKAGGDPNKVHICHDLYAPLINRRLEFSFVKDFLETRGLHSIERTINHTELCIRAFKGDTTNIRKEILPKKEKPYWFERYR